MKNGTYVFILRNFRHKTTEFTIFRNGTYDIDEPEYLYYYQLKFGPPLKLSLYPPVGLL